MSYMELFIKNTPVILFPFYIYQCISIVRSIISVYILINNEFTLSMPKNDLIIAKAAKFYYMGTAIFTYREKHKLDAIMLDV